MDKSAWDAVFAARFEKHEEELRALYTELYHGDDQAWEYFVGMLRRSFEARPAALRKLDAAREKDPTWYKGHELVGMLMYVSSFAGDLKGVKKKLDYIEECGVNYLHLMPLLESPAGRSDGGYAVSDFRKVEPALGTMKDLAALARDCHKRDIAVCLDFVMNHTSEDHEWARRARAGEKEYQDWIASGGMGKFPGGEDPKDFIKRCADTFEDCADRFLLSPGMPDSAAALVHGGTIMSILSVFGDRSKAYYDWHVPCGGGFRLLLDRELWEKGGGIRSVEKLFPDGEPD